MQRNSTDDPLFAELSARLTVLLPGMYQDAGDTVQPTPMGSAALKFNSDGSVAWNEIWGSFCDLAMAGGPPHKGKLLTPASGMDVPAETGDSLFVAREICRGIQLTTGLPANLSRIRGWIRVSCPGRAMAGWLLRAITMENVSVRSEGSVLLLPAGPAFRLQKEIKNVITVTAKTSHYWLEHMLPEQHKEIAELLTEMESVSPMVQPAFPGTAQRSDDQRLSVERLGETLRGKLPLAVEDHGYAGWLGARCESVAAAIWLMRMLAAVNVLARREDTVLFLPVNGASDPGGARIAASLVSVYRLEAGWSGCLS